MKRPFVSSFPLASFLLGSLDVWKEQIVSSLIESSARVAPYSSASLHDTDVLKTIRESIDEGTMSGPLFSRLVGLDEIGSKRLLAGEKVELTYRSMISILRLADVLRK